MRRIVALAGAAVLAAGTFTGAAHAQVVQTIGSGSAVSSVDAWADFESDAALWDNPYEENGLYFSRTDLTFNNNSCGYAGCAHAFPYFSGNYMYGTGAGGYFSMFLNEGRFYGLEFILGTGWGTSYPVNVVWHAFLGGSETASGTFTAVAGDVAGFSSATGFDELRYTAVHESSTTVAPAFDAVRAQTASVATVPEPMSLLLLATGLTGLGAVAVRRRRLSPHVEAL